MSDVKEQVLDVVEDVVEKVVDANAAKVDQVVDLVLAKLCQLIPGKIDDALAAEKAPEIKAYVHAQLDKLVDKIDGKVG